MPLDIKAILEMEDEKFNERINADHEELSEDEHNIWLIQSAKIKAGREEILEERAEIRSRLVPERTESDVLEDGKRNQLYGRDNGNGKDRQKGPEYDEILELNGNVYYQINVKPPKFVIALKQNKQLVEASLKVDRKEIDGYETLVQSLIYNKTFLTCIPTKIVRHKNPLTFLDQAAKYTMTFLDAAGEQYSFSHKALTEIMSGLRDLGYVFGDGAEGALGTMVQAFKENKLIEDNQDMDYIGFFIVDKKIIASNIEIKSNIIPTQLEDALKLIDEELVPYYQERLNLLSTVIVGSLVAPAIYMLKTNNYFLKFTHFYGFPNATKSNSDKIGLAIDGHQDDPDFILNIGRIDTIARLGDAISHTTFPKLVDEADLNGPDKVWLINALKSAIESKVVRSKYMTNRSIGASAIPALSPLAFTSNPPPPFYDSGYMRRVVDRNFPISESHKEDDPVAIKFKEFLCTNLDRLRELGEFRNWFIMNNQDLFLNDANRPLPLDIGFQILTVAYQMTGREMPKWFNMRLPECQLEDSISDNSVIVKRAFETYIDVNFRNALNYWQRTEAAEDKALGLPKETSLRLVKLIDWNLLPDIKRSPQGDIIIRKGLLVELQRCGVTREQLPNLQALRDYMGADYRKVHGNWVINCTGTQLADYFDKIEEIEELKDNDAIITYVGGLAESPDIYTAS